MTINFTLNDFKNMMREEVRTEVADQFHVFIKDIFQPALDYIDNRFDRMDERFDRLEADVAGIKRVVRKHSADISELQALCRA